MNKRALQRNLLFLATAISMTVYITWRSFFTLPLTHGIPSLLLGLLLLVCEIVAGFEAVEQYLNMTYSVKPELPVIPEAWYPEVDVLIATHNENVDILYKTVNACTYLAYPDKKKVHIYICDDNNRPEMRELAARLKVGYFGLTDNKHAKAGNINNALRRTTSPLIATFDADMIPQRNFLMRTIPYFFLPKLKKNPDGTWVTRNASEIDEKYKIGFIQTPQSFYNPDLFQFNLHAEQRVPNEQDYFFREINVGRNRTNTAIYAGSNTVISREALDDVGGLAVNTITEDFETGLKIQAKGYSTYAIPEVLAHGLAPHTIGSLISQRERWGRGCVQSLRHIKPFFKKGLSLASKASYLATMIYWWTFFRRFVYITTPILATLFSLRVVECTVWQIAMFWLPYYFFNAKALSALSGNTRTQHWSNLIDTILFPYMIIPIFLETIGLEKKKFVVTKKTVEKASGSKLASALPHIVLLAASIVALMICVRHSLETRSVYNAIIIFWLVVNGKNLTLAIFFMMGRQNYRSADRFTAKIPLEIEYKNRICRGLTSDISETGMSVDLDFPVFLPDSRSFKVRLSTADYQAEMWCEVVHVDPQKNGGWRYSFRLTDISEENRREYFQIVYDRRHSLPDMISETLNVFDDLRLNLDKRLTVDERKAIRKLPRITVGVSGRLANGQSVFIKDYNYKYVWVTNDNHIPLDDIFAVTVTPGIDLVLTPVTRKGSAEKNGLYHVLNWEPLMNNHRFERLISEWVAAGQSATVADLSPTRPFFSRWMDDDRKAPARPAGQVKLPIARFQPESMEAQCVQRH